VYRDFRLEHPILQEDGSIIWVKTDLHRGFKKVEGMKASLLSLALIENTTEQRENRT